MICDDDFGCILSKASRLSKAHVNKKLGEIGLTFPQFIVIRHLYKGENENYASCVNTPASIAERLGYDRPTMTGIIDRLEKQGFVQREINPCDRRSQTIKLTEKAAQLIQKMKVLIKEVNDTTLDGFLEPEIDKLKGYLLRIIDNLDEQEECSNIE